MAAFIYRRLITSTLLKFSNKAGLQQRVFPRRTATTEEERKIVSAYKQSVSGRPNSQTSEATGAAADTDPSFDISFANYGLLRLALAMVIFSVIFHWLSLPEERKQKLEQKKKASRNEEALTKDGETTRVILEDLEKQLEENSEKEQTKFY
ncbi:unnamed protein product [Didymodactylos carnosus]|uniref:Uncharacterized protein n=1 Tax=Didymodactylos carnosus TaxID=1234261 RepID=A0A815DBZ9_9BILA|nr:unnamed protein product [Didymodactylos carnosus]CAF1294977.1 unnamed protein product [Didymodactylos carnosus]CAF3916662.1 unnamed protein product [Didymodactylos carnosus]CAF4107820.1 unnamed protein product [Didymodactylos carnosus]